jgi:hypothetical protein
MLGHLAFIARDAGISDLHAHTLPDNRRALRVLDKLGFPCTVARKRNMMHVTVHLDSTAHPDGTQAPRKLMSPATDRVLAEGLTSSKTIIRLPSSGALHDILFF